MRDLPNISQRLLAYSLSLPIKECVIILSLCLVGPIFLLGQKRTAPSEKLLKLLGENISQGNLIAFRDLAKLHDKHPDNQRVTKLLKQHTLFTTSEWDWNTKEKNNLLTDFFYEKEALLQFSELLEVFYLTPVEARQATIKIKPINAVQIDPFLIRKSIQTIGKALVV